jgi:hypothetical protein
MVSLPQGAESKGRKNEYFNLKKLNVQRPTNFKLLSKIKGSSINYRDFFTSIIFVWDGHYDYWPRVLKNVATSLGCLRASGNYMYHPL